MKNINLKVTTLQESVMGGGGGYILSEKIILFKRSLEVTEQIT